jgi:hypothetical protein
VALGALVVVVGCADGYDIAPLPPGTVLNGDKGCADNAGSQGQRCTQDCVTATCNGGTGRRVCTCSGGVYLQCACLPPENWPYDDVPAAPYCDAISGQPRYLNTDICTGEGRQCVSSLFAEQGCTCTAGAWKCGSNAGYAAGAENCESLGRGIGKFMDEHPCDSAWQLCISRDFNPTGTSPRGCVCTPEGTQLVWQCGATNRWYRAE